MAGRVAGHQDAPGPGRARGEPGRDGTRPRPEARTRDHPGPAAPPRRVPAPGSETSRPCGDAVTCGDAVKILSDGRYQSGPSHQLLPPLCGPSPEPPDPFDEHRDEPATTRRAAEATTRVKSLSGQGWKAHTARLRPAPSTRPGPAGCSPPEDSAPERSVDRQRTSQSFSGALPPLPTSRTVTPYPTEGNQNTWQTILAPDRLQRETETEKIAVVPDNARPHHAKALTALHEPGRLLERITPIHLSPYVPDHQPGRARPERGQERHRHHPARDTRRNPRRVRPTHHRPNIRPRLRAPSRPAKPETILLHDSHSSISLTPMQRVMDIYTILAHSRIHKIRIDSKTMKFQL